MEIYAITAPNPRLTVPGLKRRIGGGLYNGYVIFKDNNKIPYTCNNDLYDFNNPDLNEFISVNGGITFDRNFDEHDKEYPIISYAHDKYNLPNCLIGYRIIGFDTLHEWDNENYWTEDKVLEEAKYLAEQIYLIYLYGITNNK